MPRRSDLYGWIAAILLMLFIIAIAHSCARYAR